MEYVTDEPLMLFLPYRTGERTFSLPTSAINLPAPFAAAPLAFRCSQQAGSQHSGICEYRRDGDFHFHLRNKEHLRQIHLHVPGILDRNVRVSGRSFRLSGDDLTCFVCSCSCTLHRNFHFHLHFQLPLPTCGLQRLQDTDSALTSRLSS